MSDPIPPRRKKRVPGQVQAHNNRVQAEANERKAKVYAMWKAGASAPDIARQLEIDRTTVSHYIKEAREERANAAENGKREVYELTLAQIDQDIVRLNASLGRVKSVAESVKIILALSKLRDERARYMGLFAPERHEIAFPNVDVSRLTHDQKVRIANGDVSVLEEIAASGAVQPGSGTNGTGSH